MFWLERGRGRFASKARSSTATSIPCEFRCTTTAKWKFGNATNYANNLDIVSSSRWAVDNVTIIDDDASSQDLTLTSSRLGPRLRREAGGRSGPRRRTTPSRREGGVAWISPLLAGLLEGGGEDFIHDGTQKDTVGFLIYTGWLPTLKGSSGTYLQQPTAVYIDFSQG